MTHNEPSPPTILSKITNTTQEEKKSSRAQSINPSLMTTNRKMLISINYRQLRNIKRGLTGLVYAHMIIIIQGSRDGTTN